MDHLVAASRIANSGLTAQSLRVRVATENVANAHATANTPGGEPYRRKLVVFERGDFGNQAGVSVSADDIVHDTRPSRLEYEPGHPAANTKGFVAYPNIDVTVELADIREANRTYVANLQVIKQTRDAINATIDLLRGS
jgi:flagellar basal-body rod protein FlgC